MGKQLVGGNKRVNISSTIITNVNKCIRSKLTHQENSGINILPYIIEITTKISG